MARRRSVKGRRQDELIGELNLILCPAVDRAKGSSSVFDFTE